MDTIPETGISKAETDALLAVNNANRKVLYSKKKKNSEEDIQVGRYVF